MDFSVIHDNLGYLLWGTWPDGPRIRTQVG